MGRRDALDCDFCDDQIRRQTKMVHVDEVGEVEVETLQEGAFVLAISVAGTKSEDDPEFKYFCDEGCFLLWTQTEAMAELKENKSLRGNLAEKVDRNKKARAKKKPKAKRKTRRKKDE